MERNKNGRSGERPFFIPPPPPYKTRNPQWWKFPRFKYDH